MTGTTLSPQTAGTLGGWLSSAGPQVTSLANSFRVSAVMERLALYMQPGYTSDPQKFIQLCLALARGIDYAVANNEIPGKAGELPFLLKQLCQSNTDPLLRAGLMVLIISVKNACKLGWFSTKETEELFVLANEVSSSFCSLRDIDTGHSSSLSTISTIMDRFYPRLKMSQILVSLEVKPGYEAIVTDIHISKTAGHSPQDKIRLFVAKIDNIETSACIINPPQVSILLNGKGVDRRTNVLMDPGPQMPTNVTAMLKYGSNLLQAVGQFNGHYIIVVAFMSIISPTDTQAIPDYVPPAVSSTDSDPDLIEGPSRISLNCPISYTRIKIPVKGHSCKHLQCFDFNNYVDINSRRPSWRCPHCNQCVCYLDIRVDQNIFKVLREVGENVSDVIISADGSWKAVIESDDHVDHAQDETVNCLKEGPECPESTLSNFFDLTDGDDKMDAVSTFETEDRKPFHANIESQSVPTNLTLSSDMNIDRIYQNITAQEEDDFWSGIYFSTGSVVSSSRPDVQMAGGIYESNPTILQPLSTNDMSPSFNHVAEFRGYGNHTATPMHGQLSLHNNLQLQESQIVNSNTSNEYGSIPSIPGHITRTPIAVQALPVQSQTPGQFQRSRTGLNSLASNALPTSHGGQSEAPTQDGIDRLYNELERQHQFSRHHVNPLQVSADLSAAALHHQSMIQNQDRRDRSFTPGQSIHQVGLPPMSQVPNIHRSSPLLSSFQNSHLQQAFNPRASQPMTSNMNRPSSQLPHTQSQQGVTAHGVALAAGYVNNQQSRFMSASQRAPHMVSRQMPSPSVHNQAARTGQSFQPSADNVRISAGLQRGSTIGVATTLPRPESLVDLPSEQNWRPTGRMRGSLSGQAYSDALNQFMIQPTQAAEPARPPPNSTPQLNISPHLQALMASSRNSHVHNSQPHDI